MTTMYLSGAGEGAELDSPDATVTVKVGAEHTGGAYELFEIDAPRGPTVPPHRTPWLVTHYVLHGRMGVFVDGEIHDLGPGASVTIPAGTPHTFTVHTPSVRFLALSTGEAMSRFFRDVHETVPRGTPLEKAAELLGEVVARHGVTLAEWSP
ncbi:cupin domain-containing protein [Prauserella flavalba]|uniref:cupin domain-containing protein n=1 Tax=Prauserella flavalba TaxID=1477506 RepID=UPI0036F1150B